MRTFLGTVCLSAFFASTFAVAGVEKGNKKYVEYYVDYENVENISMKVKSKFSTDDTCNHFTLDGTFHFLMPQGESRSSQQVFYGDFSVMQTKMACPSKDRNFREVEVSTEAFEIQADENRGVSLRVLLPEGLDLVVTAKGYMPSDVGGEEPTRSGASENSAEINPGVIDTPIDSTVDSTTKTPVIPPTTGVVRERAGLPVDPEELAP